MHGKLVHLGGHCWIFGVVLGGFWAFGGGLEMSAQRQVKLSVPQKRGDVDVPTCIANFDIHPDKIIRTVDSRAMGARYLNEIDLDSREQCLRLCCETDNCDVFVFEEKNAGSCYLFECGPPEDFKCKFTHHTNYTAAVLAMSRRQPDLESEIKLSKHELELSRLRKLEAQAVEITPRPQLEQLAAIATMTTTTLQPTTAAKVQNLHASGEEKSKDASSSLTVNRKCKEYQFECRSTGECIAIYNACDGIPQCADGSDEGPELKCPGASTSSPQIAPQQAQLTNQNMARVQPLNVQSNGPFRMGMPHPEVGPAHSQSVRQGSGLSKSNEPATGQQSPDFLRPVADAANPLRMQQYDRQQMVQYPYLVPDQNTWGHQVPPQIAPHYQQQFSNIDQNGHNFNHKGPGVPDMIDQSQLQFGVDGREYPKFANYYNSDVYKQQMPQLQQMPENNWPPNNVNNPQEYRSNGLYAPTHQLNGLPGGRETWSQNVQGPKNEASSIIYQKAATNELVTSNKKDHPKQEQEKVADQLKNSKQLFATPAEDVSEETEKRDGHDHNHARLMVTKYKVGETDAFEDGIAETPGGAVLSLTLGLILTALMGILIGCRLRVVRRRLRRGSKSFSHDDYLVNGMYL